MLALTQSRSPGKERDSETGLDYFGARYYGSNMGRWMSPDWSAAPTAIPYADLSDPQTVNLYGYLRNSPLSKADADGHCSVPLVCPLVAAGSTAVAATVAAGGAVVTSAYAVITRTADAYISNQNDKALLYAIESKVAAENANILKSNPGDSTDPKAKPIPPAGIIGTQDEKSGQAGNRWKSGPLSPDHGGTGDATNDFDKLTGGKSAPAPADSTYPPGTQIGPDGTMLRPETEKAGPRIDVPASGDKPHETMHYPKGDAQQ